MFQPVQQPAGTQGMPTFHDFEQVLSEFETCVSGLLPTGVCAHCSVTPLSATGSCGSRLGRWSDQEIRAVLGCVRRGIVTDALRIVKGILVISTRATLCLAQRIRSLSCAPLGDTDSPTGGYPGRGLRAGSDRKLTQSSELAAMIPLKSKQADLSSRTCRQSYCRV